MKRLSTFCAHNYPYIMMLVLTVHLIFDDRMPTDIGPWINLAALYFTANKFYQDLKGIK